MRLSVGSLCFVLFVLMISAGLCIPISNPEAKTKPLSVNLLRNKSGEAGMAIGEGPIPPGIYNIVTYKAAKSMRQVPQWHCLRYRKFDLVKRCRNYRVGRRTWRNDGAVAPDDVHSS